MFPITEICSLNLTLSMIQKRQTQRLGVFSPLNYVDFHIPQYIQLSFAVPPLLCKRLVKSNDCLFVGIRFLSTCILWTNSSTWRVECCGKKKGKILNNWKLFVSSYCGEDHLLKDILNPRSTKLLKQNTYQTKLQLQWCARWIR